MAKKKKQNVLRPWCWYCEREFEDEKVLMQHQKAKHFKCGHCPRRLNTAGGLAVHIQQVHKLDPEPIENALPNRNGYEVEIFGMEGIPAPDLADYKRRKEQELGLTPGSISQPQAKRPKVENRPLSEAELQAQLKAHKALMGATDDSKKDPAPAPGGAVFHAEPQAYVAPAAAAPPVPFPFPPPPFPGMPPPGMLPGAPPAIPGVPPFPPMPGMPPGVPPPGFPPFAPPPGIVPGAPGSLPFPPGAIPPGAPLPGFVPSASAPVGAPGVGPPLPPANGTAAAPVTTSLPAAPPPNGTNVSTPPPASASTAQASAQPAKGDSLIVWTDANLSPLEKRAAHPKYAFGFKPLQSTTTNTSDANDEEMKGRKRARAEDFL